MAEELSSRILACLEEKPRSISEIARELDEEKYEVSKQIEVLSDQGHINTYRIGRSTACILRSDDATEEEEDVSDAAADPVDDPGEEPAAVGDERVDVREERESRREPAPAVQPRQGGPRTIGIVSGKGGVGKTVVTLNIGAALMSFGENVIVMDADAEMPNMGIHLGIHTYPTSLAEVVEKDVHIMSAMHVDSDSGLRVIPTALSVEPAQEAVGEAIGMIPENYTVLVDSPPGYERPLERVIQTCDELVFVTTPEIPALADTFKLYREAQRYGKQALGVVVNMYSSSKNHLSLAEVEEALELPVLGVINHTKLVPRSIMANTPLVSHKPHAKPSREFKRIAANLSGHTYDPSVVDRIKGLLP